MKQKMRRCLAVFLCVLMFTTSTLNVFAAEEVSTPETEVVTENESVPEESMAFPESSSVGEDGVSEDSSVTEEPRMPEESAASEENIVPEESQTQDSQEESSGAAEVLQEESSSVTEFQTEENSSAEESSVEESSGLESSMEESSAPEEVVEPEISMLGEPSVQSVYASGTYGGNINWAITQNGAAGYVITLSGNGEMAEPEDGYPWDPYYDIMTALVVGEGITTIADGAFYQCIGLQSVQLPSTLTSIADGAFADCYNLTQITLPEGLVSIGSFVLQNTAITSLTLPASLKSIGRLCTFGCSSFTGYEVKSGNSVYSAVDGVLFNKDKTVLYSYPMGKIQSVYKVPQSVHTIGEYAFRGAFIDKVEFQGGITTLEEGALCYSTIKTLTIPDSVTTIGDFLCEGCSSLQSISIGDGLESLSYKTFYECTSLTDIEWGASLTDLNNLTFGYCTSLKSVVIPNKVTEIKNGVFGECSALQKVTLPSGLTQIMYQAFLNCKSLESIVLPQSMITINQYAFYGTGIKEVRIPASVKEVGENAFPTDTVLIFEREMEQQGDGSYLYASKLPLEVSYNYAGAFEVLEIVNRERAKAGLSPLTMDKDLLEAAMVRATELGMYFSHTRPTGQDCFSASSKMYGENISGGYGSATSAMEGWMNSDGHRGNILGSDYVSIGVGAVVIDGIPYWTQAFGVSDVDAASRSDYSNYTTVTDVKFVTPYASDEENFHFCVYDVEDPIEVGTSKEVQICVDNTWVMTSIDKEYLAFSSENPDICKASQDGVLTGVKKGKAQITLSLRSSGEVLGSFEVSVAGGIEDGLNKGSDGVWYYYKDGTIDWSYTGLTKYYGTWYYVEKGVLNWDYTGLTKYYGTWYYVEKGILNWDYTGLTKYYGTWYYVEKGILNWDYTGLTNYWGTWYYVEKGILNWDYTGLTNYWGTWYYVEKGILNWDYTGLTNYWGTWYYVEKGILNWDYTGLTNYWGTWYYVEKGILNWNYTDLTNYWGTWYYVEKGILNWDFTGLTDYYGTLYYVKEGILDWKYNGTAVYNGKQYQVIGGIAKK